jgi:hypothetical protein
MLRPPAAHSKFSPPCDQEHRLRHELYAQLVDDRNLTRSRKTHSSLAGEYLYEVRKTVASHTRNRGQGRVKLPSARSAVGG